MDNNVIIDRTIAAIIPLLIAVIDDEVEVCIHCVGCSTTTLVVEIPSIVTESLTLGAHAQRGWVCVCVCVCVRHPNLTYRPTNDTIYLTGNEGQKICRILSEIAAFVSYGVKQKLKSRYANERWAQTAPFRAGGVSEVTCRISAFDGITLLRIKGISMASRLLQKYGCSVRNLLR